MAHSLIALGANQGYREQSLDWAVKRLDQFPEIRVMARSRWHETLPVGGPQGQGKFLNGAVLVETSVAPEQLLTVLQQLETERGRHRETRWGPRPLDLDLLLYDQVVQNTASLTIPHPRMAWRRFVLEPAAEAAPQMTHPVIGWTVARLLEWLNQGPTYVAVTGLPAIGKTALVKRLARVAGTQVLASQAPSGDSSSIVGGMELEFLAARARLLATGRAIWSEAGDWASDFWFDQSLAYAAVELAQDARDAVVRQWEEARRGVVVPKLIVFVDAPAKPLSEPWENIRRELRLLAGRPEQGPVLYLTDATSESALAELQAAVAAMK